MTHALRIDRDVVLAGLRPADVLGHFEIGYRLVADQYRTAHCPRCGVRSRRDAVAIAADTGMWCCHVCGEKGDLLALVAAYAGLDVRADFQRVLAIAADVAGVGPVVSRREVERARAERAQREAERKVEREAEERQAAADRRLRATSEWRRGRRSSEEGEAYLRSRRLDPRFLVEQGHCLFAANGDIMVPLWDLVDGELVDVVRRVLRPEPDEPKVRGLKGGTTAGSLVGRPQEIHRTETIVCEGAIDSLTAAQLWPHATVLGAHGAGRLPMVAASAAPRVIANGSRMVLIPDSDDTGAAWCVKAGESALRAGLEMDRTLRVIDVSPHADLNAAHCSKEWHP